MTFDTSQIRDIFNSLLDIIAVYGLQVLGAIAILIIGWMIAKWSHRATDKALSRIKAVDATLRGFLSQCVKYIILIFTAFAVLDQFGVQTTSILALLGAAGLAIGLALQGTLSNLAAGIMLMLFRPFRVGDYIEAAGTAGTVKELSLFVTELATPDNVRIIVPNKDLWNASISNYSYHQTRRIQITVGISYDSDIDRALSVLNEIVTADARHLADPAPQIVVADLADSSVNIIVRVWCNNADFWPFRFDLMKAVKQRFDKEGIEIPFPQRVMHMAKEN